jgi:hypothetical protein
MPTPSLSYKLTVGKFKNIWGMVFESLLNGMESGCVGREWLSEENPSRHRFISLLYAYHLFGKIL